MKTPRQNKLDIITSFISLPLSLMIGFPALCLNLILPCRPPLPFPSSSSLEAAWRINASCTFGVLRYVALHGFWSTDQPLKYINLIKKK